MRAAFTCLAAAVVVGACDSSKATGPTTLGDSFVLTAAQKSSLDSTGTVIKSANPANSTLAALVDSTLQVLAAGVEARHLNITTNLTTKPLYFVLVHHTFQSPGNSWGTWNMVGFDDPSHMTVLVEVSGFAQNGTATSPVSVSGTIADGTGTVNGLMMEVASGGAVTTYSADGGSVSFTGGTPGGACPNFTPTANLNCTTETTMTQFTMTAGAKTGTLSTAAEVAGMRVNYTP